MNRNSDIQFVLVLEEVCSDAHPAGDTETLIRSTELIRNLQRAVNIAPRNSYNIFHSAELKTNSLSG